MKCGICGWYPFGGIHKQECSYWRNHKECGYCGAPVDDTGCKIIHNKKCIFVKG